MPTNSKVLLFSSNETMAKYIADELYAKAGYYVCCVANEPAAIANFRQGGFGLVMFDWSVSEAENLRLIKELKTLDPDCLLVAFLDNASRDLLKEICDRGIYDFLAKPIDLERLFFIVKKGLILHSSQMSHRKLMQGLQEQIASLQKQNAILNKRYDEASKNLARLYEEVRTTYMRTIKTLARAIDARDHYTHSHSENVARYASAIGNEMGLMAKDIEIIREACELHDLGKIGIQDDILSKPSSLTPEEWAEVKMHPALGAHILESLTFLNEVVQLIRQHHEHYDGSGYPEGLKGEQILLGARIIHLADAYEAMIFARAYRKIPLTKEQAIAEIKKQSGTQFDPRVVEAFLKVVYTSEFNTSANMSYAKLKAQQE